MVTEKLKLILEELAKDHDLPKHILKYREPLILHWKITFCNILFFFIWLFVKDLFLFVTFFILGDDSTFKDFVTGFVLKYSSFFANWAPLILRNCAKYSLLYSIRTFHGSIGRI